MSSDQLEEYESQLADIEELLEADPTDESILKLKSDLVELIALTKEEDVAPEETTTTTTTTTTAESTTTESASPVAEAPVETAPVEAAPVAAAAAEAPPDANEPPRKKLKKVKDFEVPAHLQILETDDEKEVNRKKRSLKALKSKHRSKQRDYESTKKQQSWQNFSNKKGGKKSKKKSIFATQEGSNAKVGVVSGGSMTEFGERKRHKYN